MQERLRLKLPFSYKHTGTFLIIWCSTRQIKPDKIRVVLLCKVPRHLIERPAVTEAGSHE